jgi:hypothetical protein
MDLLGRKLGMNKGKPVMDLLGAMQTTIAGAKKQDTLKGLAEKLEATVNKLGEVGMHIGAKAMSPEVLNTFSFASSFLEVTGDVVMAWMLLWRASVAAKKLDDGAKKKDVAFYEGQIKSAEFFMHAMLPVTMGKMVPILAGNDAVVKISEDSFGGK